MVVTDLILVMFEVLHTWGIVERVPGPNSKYQG
jgi:hypothetical protein